MLPLQTLLIAEEIQKDAQRRAEQARLLKQLAVHRTAPLGNFRQFADGVRNGVLLVTQLWPSFLRLSRLFSPSPTC